MDEWRDGLLRSRTYERLDAPGDLIRIDYGAGYRWGAPPPRLELHNGWYGYRLEVVTTSADALPSHQAPPDESPNESPGKDSPGLGEPSR